MGTRALAAADLGGTACGVSPLGRGRHWPTIEPLSRRHTNCRTIIAKKFLHCCKGSRAHNRFPNLGIWQKDWEPPGKQQNLLCTRTWEKGAMTPQETEPDLPVIVLESLVEAWVDRGLPWGQGHWLPQSWELQYVGIYKSFWRPNYREGTQPYPWAENRIKDLLSIYWDLLAHQSKTQFYKAILSIRKLPQASYPHPSDRMKPQSQKTNHTDHMDHNLVWLNETLSHIRNKRVLFEPDLGLSLWDSLSDHSEELLWRSMVFSKVLYFVRTKYIKQIRETFLQGFFFFFFSPKISMFTKSVWPWDLGRESFQLCCPKNI